AAGGQRFAFFLHFHERGGGGHRARDLEHQRRAVFARRERHLAGVIAFGRGVQPNGQAERFARRQAGGQFAHQAVAGGQRKRTRVERQIVVAHVQDRKRAVRRTADGGVLKAELL